MPALAHHPSYAERTPLRNRHLPVHRHGGLHEAVARVGCEGVYWPKSSDPSADYLRRITRDDRSAFPFLRLAAGRPLSLAAHGLLRSSLASGAADAIGDAL